MIVLYHVTLGRFFAHARAAFLALCMMCGEHCAFHGFYATLICGYWRPGRRMVHRHVHKLVYHWHRSHTTTQWYGFLIYKLKPNKCPTNHNYHCSCAVQNKISNSALLLQDTLIYCTPTMTAVWDSKRFEFVSHKKSSKPSTESHSKVLVWSDLNL